MKKYKTEQMVIHIEVDTTNATKHITVDAAERRNITQTIHFTIPAECSKKTISDVGIAKHILNYFIKE